MMKGSRNEFFSCTSISINEPSRVCHGKRLLLLQHMAQLCAFSDDLREIHFAADFIFEIELFLGQLLFQLSNLPKGTRILYGNGNLICDLGQKLDIVAGERSVLIFDHTENPQNATSPDKRKDRNRSHFGLRAVLHPKPPPLPAPPPPGS